MVLTLAVGQNAALACRIWCEPHQAAATECHHADGATVPTLTGKDACDDMALGAMTFVREDVRRRASSPDARHAVAVPAFRFAPPPTDLRSGHDPGQQSLPAARPLVIAIRI
jgi:hypothetical protein